MGFSRLWQFFAEQETSHGQAHTYHGFRYNITRKGASFQRALVLATAMEPGPIWQAMLKDSLSISTSYPGNCAVSSFS